MLNLGEIDLDVLEITKAKLGLSSIIDDATVRLIRFAIVAAQQELTNDYGLKLNISRADHVNVITDLALFNYQIKDGTKGPLPRNLEFRINNLVFGGYYE